MSIKGLSTRVSIREGEESIEVEDCSAIFPFLFFLEKVLDNFGEVFSQHLNHIS